MRTGIFTIICISLLMAGTNFGLAQENDTKLSYYHITNEINYTTVNMSKLKWVYEKGRYTAELPFRVDRAAPAGELFWLLIAYPIGSTPISGWGLYNADNVFICKTFNSYKDEEGGGMYIVQDQNDLNEQIVSGNYILRLHLDKQPTEELLSLSVGYSTKETLDDFRGQLINKDSKTPAANTSSSNNVSSESDVQSTTSQTTPVRQPEATSSSAKNAETNPQKEKGDAYYDNKDYTSAAQMYSQCMKTDEDCLFKYAELVLSENVESKSLDELFSLLSSLAEKNNSEAQFYLGWFHIKIKKDTNESVKWFRKSAENGDHGGQYTLGLLYRSGIGVSKDNVESFKWIRKSAEQGRAEAQNSLGKLYETGNGVSKNYSEAVKWYRKAVEQDYLAAKNSLGKMYENGYGVSKNYAEALKLYRETAEKGNAEGQNNLGYMYENGYGVQKNYVEAIKLYRKSAEQDNAAGQFSLGRAYATGYDLIRDTDEAEKLFRKSAEQGYAEAQNKLAEWHRWGMISALKGKYDYEGAMKWSLKSAEQGNARGQLFLGYIYKNVYNNYPEALKWFRKAAEQGDVEGQNFLGEMYYYGLGISKDYSEALKWIQKAAEQGDVNSQLSLGKIYYNGGYGVQKNKTEAVKWFIKAAEYREEAGYELGKMYENGDGVTKDKAEAIKWYLNAANKRHKPARESLIRLRGY